MKFTELYHDRIFGVIEGLDRIRFQGTDRAISNTRGINKVLRWVNILLKDFGRWAEGTTKALRTRCSEQACMLGIPMEYLRKSGVDKEARAREIVQEQGMGQDGSICMFSVMESCVAPEVCGNKQSKKLELQMRQRKCIFIYHYFDDPEVGFGHVRLQTWLPYSVKICLNGRHWLEKQLLANQVDYQKKGNCFSWISDIDRAQELLDEQLKTNWPTFLDGLVDKVCPGLATLCAPFKIQYYWSAEETEYATDVMFRSGADLDALFPKLIGYGMRVSDCPAVLRYFGRRAEGSALGKAPDEVQSDCRKRHEAVRIKHWVNGDSIKMYNKERSVLRVEMTINKPRNFKAFRPANDDDSQPPTWQRMRKGIQDLHRRCEISKKCNERYLDAMTAIQVDKTLREVASAACNRTSRNGLSVRGLNPWNEQDFRLLTFLVKGEWNVNGFRNAHLCKWLQPNADKLPFRERKKLSAKVTRQIGLLRAHGLVRKVGRTHRYMLTGTGRTFANALVLASSLEAKQLMELAA